MLLMAAQGKAAGSGQDLMIMLRHSMRQQDIHSRSIGMGRLPINVHMVAGNATGRSNGLHVLGCLSLAILHAGVMHAVAA